MSCLGTYKQQIGIPNLKKSHSRPAYLMFTFMLHLYLSRGVIIERKYLQDIFTYSK